MCKSKAKTNLQNIVKMVLNFKINTTKKIKNGTGKSPSAFLGATERVPITDIDGAR